MNFFEIFDKNEYSSILVAKNADRSFSLHDISELIKPVVFSLSKNECAKVTISAKNNLDFLINFLSAVFAEKEIYLLSDEKKSDKLDFEHIVLDTIPQTARNSFKLEKPEFEKVYINLFTSGSSGAPKIIRKTLKNLILEASEVYEEYREFFDKEKTEVVTSTTPHHMFGLTCYIMIPLCNVEKFSINLDEIIYPDCADLKDKVFVSTPSFLDKFPKHNVSAPEKPSLILTAGDKLNEDVYSYFDKYKIKVSEIYGSSETGVIAHKESYENYFKCFKNVKAIICQDGKLSIESPYFMENSTVLFDNAEMKNDREFALKSRSDRILKIQEKRISAQEIENIINSTEFIEDSYCFKFGEKLACAAVLSDEGKNFYLDRNNGGFVNLTKLLKSSVRKHSDIIPQKWKFIHNIPKTQTGKIYKDLIMSYFEKNISLPLILDTETNFDKVIIRMTFCENCNFFKGHFENFPILPGVVQLYFAHMFAQQFFKVKVKESPVKKVKFSHLIRPNDILTLELLKNSGENINYSYKKDELLCSSGIFVIQD